MKQGRFIVLEGLDGSGKSTAAELLKQKLTQPGAPEPFLTREPSDGPIGRLIRQALTKEITLDPKTFTLLFAADRFEHVQNEILPALKEGRDVLCDRYYFSNLAYQGDVAPMDTILGFNSLARTAITPDVVFFIDTPPEECMRRIHSGRDAEELFERIDKLKSVQALYKEAFERLQKEEHVVCIDGTLTPEEIISEMMQYLQK